MSKQIVFRAFWSETLNMSNIPWRYDRYSVGVPDPRRTWQSEGVLVEVRTATVGKIWLAVGSK